MNQAEVIGLFPIPLLAFQTERSFTQEEKNFFQAQSKKVARNEGNLVTIDKYVLKDPSMATISKEIQTAIEVYLNQIIAPENELEIYVTQSWLNYTSENQYHQKHLHQNSLLSGVYYIDTDKNTDRTYFCKEGHDQIRIMPKELTIWNAKEWWIPVNNGMIIVFPSTLVHKVEAKKGKSTRCSLAFNTFIRGKIGSHDQISELVI